MPYNEDDEIIFSSHDDKPAVIVFAGKFMIADLSRASRAKRTRHHDRPCTTTFEVDVEAWEERQYTTTKPYPLCKAAMVAIKMLSEIAERTDDQESLERLQALCVFNDL
jgi:2-methylcitrate dehydratase PrpD